MKVSKEELLHIVKLSNLRIKEEEIDDYMKNLEEILSFVKVLNNVDTSQVDETIGQVSGYNVFRKDEVKQFENRELLLQNAPESEDGMFKIPKVIN
jgi:aspartyl-tRNA(Asn)/glutamyl-tRNA(Gln) amidotransferase subunit C